MSEDLTRKEIMTAVAALAYFTVTLRRDLEQEVTRIIQKLLDRHRQLWEEKKGE